MQIESMERMVYYEFESTQTLAGKLYEKIEKLAISPKGKHIPNSMWFSHHVPIQHATKPVEMFPFVFPQYKPKQHTGTKESFSESYSLFTRTMTKEEGPQSSRQHLLPIYEPLSSQFTRYPTLDLNGKGKIPKTHTF